MAKPIGTKIKIRRKSDQLDLIVPRHQQITRAAQHQIGLTLIIDLAAILMMSLSLGIFGHIQRLTAQVDADRSSIIGLAVGLLFTAPLALWLLGMAFQNSVEVCKQIFSDTLISIDRRHISLSTQFGNFDWGTVACP